ncbi:MAG: hypothetical protein GY745_19375 [Actinomycetia bacterium]|nr:hypothetical protein [Actinomycetes bacterium]MCP3912147.1 hypothetical protein [Actinomycetes bacterium]MCP4087182.1 hypothetical protein [Actinomycetes bacterium]
MNRLGIESLRWSGIRFLRDRSARHRRDHILAITADQVMVIECRRAKGTLAIVDHGTPLWTDIRLELEGRDHTRVIDGLLARIPVVTHAVETAAPNEREEVTVTGSLCVLGAVLQTHTVDWHVQAATVHSLDTLVIALDRMVPDSATEPPDGEIEPVDQFSSALARRLL